MRPDGPLRETLANLGKDPELISEWYLDGDLMGKSESKMDYSKNQKHTPYSIAYICPECGVLWGRIAIVSSKSLWIGVARPCPNHGPGVMGRYNDEVYTIPQELALREFELMKKCGDYETYIITNGR